MSGLFASGKFLTTLDTRQLDRVTRRLHEPLVYVDPVHGEIVVPAGFDTDFASVKSVRTVAVRALLLALLMLAMSAVPGLSKLLSYVVPSYGWVITAVDALGIPWSVLSYAAALIGLSALGLYASVVGYCNLASTVHDWIYKTGMLPRAEGDKVLARAGRAEGNAKWRTLLFWVGVRLGGKSHYNKA